MWTLRWSELEKYLPHIASGFAAMIVGSTVVVTSLLMQNMAPLQATFARFFIAFVCVLPFFWKYREKLQGFLVQTGFRFVCLVCYFTSLFPSRLIMRYNARLRHTVRSLSLHYRPYRLF